MACRLFVERQSPTMEKFFPPFTLAIEGYCRVSIEHPTAFRPEEYAEFRPDKMGKATLFQSSRLLVGLNCFEPGQEHALHAHECMDKVYHVLQGRGLFTLEGKELPMEPGMMLIAPEGVPHGIRNNGDEQLVVLAVLAPSP